MTSFDSGFYSVPDPFNPSSLILTCLERTRALRADGPTSGRTHLADFTPPQTDVGQMCRDASTPFACRAPKKSRRARARTSFDSSPISPVKQSLHGDRFITDRGSMNLDISHFALSRVFEADKADALANREEYMRSLAISLFDSDDAPDLVAYSPPSADDLIEFPSYSTSRVVAANNVADAGFNAPSPFPCSANNNNNNNHNTSSVMCPLKRRPSKILSFTNRKTPLTRPCENRLKALYTADTARYARPLSRIIPVTPERILDIPDIIDDYYLNLLDWSSTNILAIALAQNVYLWNAANANVTQLTLDNSDDYVSSLSFSEDGRYLSVGVDSGAVQLWDVTCQKQLRKLSGHLARVCSLSWNDHLLTSGSRDTNIFNHDIRKARHHLSSFQNHTHEVCGLKWSPDKLQLASGGNDNVINIWSLDSPLPVHTFTQHHAAVKAIAWCPWQRNLLASGGGTADRKIKFWNTLNGVCLNTLDTKSQVGSILWSKHVKELVSSHGYSQNQITIWKYPRLTKQVELSGHTNRVLHMAMSPDGETIASASGDETLRFWKIFSTDFKNQKRDSVHVERDLRLKIIR